MKKQAVEVMDERQKQITCRAMANAGIFLMICIIVSMLCKVFTEESLGWEFWSLLGASVVLIVSRRKLGDVEEPKDVMGKPLPTGNTRQEKNIRKKDYAIQSAIFALACTVMDILLVASGKDDVADLELAELLFPSLSKGATVAVTAVIAFVGMFLISYVFDYLLGEFYTVRKYNQMLSEMEDEGE